MEGLTVLVVNTATRNAGRHATQTNELNTPPLGVDTRDCADEVGDRCVTDPATLLSAAA